MSIPASSRILVTGGTGFISRYVVEMLKADGLNPLITTFNTKSDNSDVINADLTNISQVDDLIQNYKPQIVLHLAGVAGNANLTAKAYEDINFTGTVNLLKALGRNGLDRVVLFGSAAEYGSQQTPFREDMPLQPVSPYGISKAKANNFALDMHGKSGFPVTVLRIFTAYGYGQPSKMFLSQLITHALLNQRFSMSDGFQKRDFVHIEDVSRAIVASMTTNGAVGRVINVAGGQGIALRDVAAKVWKMCEADNDLLDVGSLPKTGDDSCDTEADISLAKEILNWQPGPNIANDDNSALKEMIDKMKLNVKMARR